MTIPERAAWAQLTKDMAGGLHQYDTWLQVPSRVKALYLNMI